MAKVAEKELGLVTSQILPQPEVVLGRLVGFDDLGVPLVDWPENPSVRPLAALSTAAYTPVDRDRTVALLFANGDPDRPVIVGLVRPTLDDVLSATTEVSDATLDSKCVPEDQLADDRTEACVDGERVVVEGKEQIVLKCGKASITLTRSGKVLIRGEYLLSRSTGANRIKGGSVQLN